MNTGDGCPVPDDVRAGILMVKSEPEPDWSESDLVVEVGRNGGIYTSPLVEILQRKKRVGQRDTMGGN